MTPLLSFDPRAAGPYRLVGRLGTGGQGVVYLGLDTDDQKVAVKMINLDLRSDPQAKALFAKEVAAAQRVAPFCTAQILHADVNDDLPYVVSEFIDGTTLHEHVMRSRPITGSSLDRLAVGTATALAAIHQAGVVHCDFKPDNVILGPDGPRVIDFGIAHFLDATKTMTVRGSLPYMAPERFHGTFGQECDVFAWAATIAFAASGRPPFGREPIAKVLHNILNEPPDLAGLSRPLEDLVRECLRKEPNTRPQAQQILLRLLGLPNRPSATLPLETVLQQGVDAAVQHPGARQTDQPYQTDQPRTGTGSGHPTPTRRRGSREPAPRNTPGTADSWRQRIVRESTDSWGISTAIFLGAVGTAVAYVVSAEVPVAGAVGAMTMVVVYGVQLLVAAALPGGDGRTRPRPSTKGPTDPGGSPSP